MFKDYIEMPLGEIESRIHKQIWGTAEGKELFYQQQPVIGYNPTAIWKTSK